MKKLKVLFKKDHCSIIFGEWFDKYNGNTYYDARIRINDNNYAVPYTYGYNHGDKQAVDESLAKIGYRLRTCKRDHFAPYRNIHIVCVDKLKRDLIKHEAV